MQKFYMMKSPLKLIIYFNISKKKRNSQVTQSYESNIVK